MQRGHRDRRWQFGLTGLVAVMVLAACGAPGAGSGSAAPASKPPASAPAQPAAPTTGGTAGATGGGAAASEAGAAPPTASAPRERVTLKIATPGVSLSIFALLAADKLGYFDTEALDVTIMQLSGTIGVAALLSGEVHFSTAATSALTAAAKGAPLKMVIALADRPSHVLIGAKGLRSAADIRDGAIAIQEPSGLTYKEARAVVQRYKLDAQNVTLMGLREDSTRITAMETGASRACGTASRR
jgi:ABC-type taurine transport system substrate-binding protein